MTTHPRRLRSLSVTIGVTALVAAGISGCAPQYEENAQGICVDPKTELRVDDNLCDDDGGTSGRGYVWYYVGSGHRAPAVGSPYKAAPGSFTTPRSYTRGGTHYDGGTTARSGTSDDGSTVTRGGFGGSGHSSS